MSKKFDVQDFMFLPIIVEIMDNLSKSNNPDVNTDLLARETAKLTVQLKNKLIAAQSILEELPGINNSIEEQTQILENNLKLLETKQKQLDKYLSLPLFQNAENLDSEFDSAIQDTAPENIMDIS